MNINTFTSVNTYDGLNKDCYLVKDNWFTVADGVSSQGSEGLRASEISVNKIKNIDLKSLVTKKDLKKLMFELDDEITLQCRGCTTFTSCIVRNNKVILMHTGDSECYIVYDNKLKEITKPFSYTYASFLRGELKKSEIKRARGSNILLECLGKNGLHKPQIEIFDLENAKGLILCSDGANYTEPDEMLKLFKKYKKNSAKKISERSRELGSQDDITVICVEF